MRILHYSLGFPPFRTGGLTKFCIDLMNQQVDEGHQVAMIWPGRMIGSSTKIKNRGYNKGILSFEIVNPLPIPYDEGITCISLFTRLGNQDVFDHFFKTYRPDVIHIHTFMGLHKSFLLSAREKKINTVFTAHDFFPICPKVTLFHDGQICNYGHNFAACSECNATALSLKEIMLLQAPIYQIVKDTYIVKCLRKKHRDSFLKNTNSHYICITDSMCTPADYRLLREYYASMLDLIDMIHYNSELTKKVYESYFGEHHSIIISITHSSIFDNRKEKEFTNHLRITYLGPQSSGKGFFLLKAALDELLKENMDFELNVYFQYKNPPSYMHVHDRYSYGDLHEIFDNTDVFIAPSIWYETFGYTVLEALSYGVPVIVSSNVGAKDIIPKDAGIVIENITGKKLLKALKCLTPTLLRKMNAVIVSDFNELTMQKMSQQIIDECYKHNTDS